MTEDRIAQCDRNYGKTGGLLTAVLTDRRGVFELHSSYNHAEDEIPQITERAAKDGQPVMWKPRRKLV